MLMTNFIDVDPIFGINERNWTNSGYHNFITGNLRVLPIVKSSDDFENKENNVITEPIIIKPISFN